MKNNTFTFSIIGLVVLTIVSTIVVVMMFDYGNSSKKTPIQVTEMGNDPLPAQDIESVLTRDNQSFDYDRLLTILQFTTDPATRDQVRRDYDE